MVVFGVDGMPVMDESQKKVFMVYVYLQYTRLHELEAKSARKVKRCRRPKQKVARASPVVWVQRYIRDRFAHGQYHALVVQLKDKNIPLQAQAFKSYMRMDCELFEEILAVVSPAIQKQDTNTRDCVSPGIIFLLIIWCLYVAIIQLPSM